MMPKSAPRAGSHDSAIGNIAAQRRRDPRRRPNWTRHDETGSACASTDFRAPRRAARQSRDSHLASRDVALSDEELFGFDSSHIGDWDPADAERARRDQPDLYRNHLTIAIMLDAADSRVFNLLTTSTSGEWLSRRQRLRRGFARGNSSLAATCVTTSSATKCDNSASRGNAAKPRKLMLRRFADLNIRR